MARGFRRNLTTVTSRQNPKITDFEKCDFRPMFEHFEIEKERKKQLTKAEKQVSSTPPPFLNR